VPSAGGTVSARAQVVYELWPFANQGASAVHDGVRRRRRVAVLQTELSSREPVSLAGTSRPSQNSSAPARLAPEPMPPQRGVLRRHSGRRPRLLSLKPGRSRAQPLLSVPLVRFRSQGPSCSGIGA